ncbi:hypothetical protein [Phenylobacterium sp.]|uniref:hypothetical protein n=1 Tax=Phenylobacterium sp. TaxID=1871053 RepID=UPI0035B40D11
MSTDLRVKRRVTGAAGAPAALKTGEIAYNMVDGYFYVGFGDDGSGNATSIKTFANDNFNISKLLPVGGGVGQALVKSSGDDFDVAWTTIAEGATYTAGTGLVLAGAEFAVDFAVVAPKASPAFTGNPTAPTPAAADNSTKIATTAYVQGELGSYAPTNSPVMTGTPTVPTAATATSNTQAASTAFVHAVVAAVMGAAPEALDTLQELAAAIGDDADFAGTVTASLAGKLTKTSNLSDLPNIASARTNMGLGTMATQNAAAVAITGGTIDGVTLDGGTF